MFVGDLVEAGFGAEEEKKEECDAKGEDENNEEKEEEKEGDEEGEGEVDEVQEERIKKGRYVLNEEEAKQLSIADVLMPLVGKSAQMPRSKEILEIIDEVLNEEGISIAEIENDKGLNIRGVLRRIVEIPTDVKWEIVRF